MKDQIREKFNINEQIIKDLITLIEKITPLVSVIREWGQVGNECAEFKAKVQKLNRNIGILKNACNIISNDSIITLINEEITIITIDLSMASQRSLQLEREYNELDREIVNYREYINTFPEINNAIVNRVLDSKVFENEQEFLAMLCMFNHIDSTLCDNKKIMEKAKEYNFEVGIEMITRCRGWNNILNYLIAN